MSNPQQTWEYSRVSTLPMAISAGILLFEACSNNLAGDVELTRGLKLDVMLERMGEKGWDLAAVTNVGDGARHFIFKRLKQ